MLLRLCRLRLLQCHALSSEECSFLLVINFSWGMTMESCVTASFPYQADTSYQNLFLEFSLRHHVFNSQVKTGFRILGVNEFSLRHRVNRLAGKDKVYQILIYRQKHDWSSIQKITFYDPTLLHCTCFFQFWTSGYRTYILIIMTNRKMKMHKHH